ncbi:hypothetical protein HYE67_000153 [Fusarium culmorum]|uniref:Uncharacterized protein n=1 Tax=Fusarium culmorum TaxID=5516 RepID=A0A2T4GFB4_FUSCU|nr:hypothetical protein FCULG_00012095 [Fusarium culmorum]QPC57922.1 hypothetical protein HYE67_000153 [Fusarium culmorum]
MSLNSQPQPVAQPARVDHGVYTRESTDMNQPAPNQPMEPQRPLPNSQPDLSLSGGENCHGFCMGRCCLIIPCPLPMDCCIIPR